MSVSTCGLICQQCSPYHINEKASLLFLHFSSLEYVMKRSQLEGNLFGEPHFWNMNFRSFEQAKKIKQSVHSLIKKFPPGNRKHHPKMLPEHLKCKILSSRLVFEKGVVKTITHMWMFAFTTHLIGFQTPELLYLTDAIEVDTSPSAIPKTKEISIEFWTKG